MNKLLAHSLRARRGAHSLFRATAVQFPAATPVGLAALGLKQRTGKLAFAFAIALLFAGITVLKAAEPETSGEVKMDAAQSAIVKDATDAAQWMAKRLSDTGYKGDFTLESLKDVDRFFDERPR